jgi:hypothetical protein
VCLLARVIVVPQGSHLYPLLLRGRSGHDHDLWLGHHHLLLLHHHLLLHHLLLHHLLLVLLLLLHGCHLLLLLGIGLLLLGSSLCGLLSGC